MIVCLCRGVTEGEIVEAARSGAACIDDISRLCEGAGADCGSCRSTIKEVLTASLTDRAA
jgi:bacterioferritin-associated ferredoxin